ncbi:bifunctional UDP-N-acetylglucosamine diphosphorylase/glucosamine-1-phosphate N-acetyltransferase GlmU [Georgenia satyanarayanai]|uniref:bifunctional UDP-N-acetylglucosamine diphosphorylase/glucosamine-1-phosphate N-acetyltransferase GlmU n=1 Tax=Georgenia satyanarayanai TaxID=860221 RepID=UPI000DA179B3|nr:bifunctional UDP-N-acetylglucosamine diphosphorylase/glucosamine-1-phosphate N-acetyltransferase GlmU [Georgenia satyanarayanai]
MSAQPAAVIVLAAGEGTRMKSRTPKVLHRIAGRSLLGFALRAGAELDPRRLAVVVRHERDTVAAHAEEELPGVVVVDQDAVPGTGRAVQCALGVLDGLEEAGAALLSGVAASGGGRLEGPVVVTAGDVPLLDSATLQQMLAAHEADGNAVTLLSTRLLDPYGYGRVVRDESGDVVAIVEERDATAEQREIDEINASVYVFDADVLRDALTRVDDANDQGEVYLTDVVALAHGDGKRVRALVVEDEWLVTGVNDRAQLAAIGAELNRRVVAEWMRAGVTVVDPATTWVDVEVRLGRDVTIHPGTQLHGSTTVDDGAEIGPDTTLRDVVVGAEATVVRTHGFSATVGPRATVGPFAYLRQDTVLGEGGKIGTFVETKDAQIGAGSKVPHLSYVGDAEIGEGTNIGAASVFVNYDGVKKHRSKVGNGARTGSDNMFVAPVTVGDGAYTGAGTVLLKDVPPGALAVNSMTQRNIEGWVLRRRPGTPSAEAASKVLGADEDRELSPQARAELARGNHGTAVPRDGDAPSDTTGSSTER